MNRTSEKLAKRIRRHQRVRSRQTGTSSRPRLSVHRSGKHVYAQVIDDVAGKTVVAASSVKAKKSGTKSDMAAAIGGEIAKKAKAAGVEAVVFDRGGSKYHGRVKALADAAREAGLKF